MVLTSFLSDDGDLSNDGDINDEGESIAVTDGLVDMVVTTFLFDYEAPVLSSLAASVPGTSPVVSGTASDDRSHVAAVQYQLNSTDGVWSSCVATDGSFDEAIESFQCAPTYPSEGMYTVYLRAADAPGNVIATSSYSSVQVEVDYPSSGGGGGCGSCDDEDQEEEDEDEEVPIEPEKKVTLCHNEDVTIEVSLSAAPAHIEHGDSFGKCKTEPVADEPKIVVTQNDVVLNGVGDLLSALITKGEMAPEEAVVIYEKVTALVELIQTLQAEKKSREGASNSGDSPTLFTEDLAPGDNNESVRRLQKFLNSQGFLVAESGAGSIGNETTFYGPQTKTAVMAFQNQYAEEILTPLNLSTGTGICGERTRVKINELIN